MEVLINQLHLDFLYAHAPTTRKNEVFYRTFHSTVSSLLGITVWCRNLVLKLSLETSPTNMRNIDLYTVYASHPSPQRSQLPTSKPYPKLPFLDVITVPLS